MTANTPPLIFPKASTAQSGFASADADRALRGYAEPVVRELLQNCLDARENDQRVEVSISIRRVPISQIPDLSGYKQALKDVIRNRTDGGMLTETDKAVADRIKRVLENKDNKMWVLVCRDDGRGLTADTMSSLLAEGNTTKAHRGAGSVGLGHLTAFGASDLRYVIYGSRGPDGRIVSGRCLLAAHLPRGETVPRSHKGTLAVSEAEINRLNDPPFQYLSQPPDLVKPYIDRITETGTAKTGTVVAILGFNHFGESAKSNKALNYIARTAAAHFAPAICDGRMEVDIKDGEKRTTLDTPDSVGKALSKDGNIIGSERWRFPEGMAHRAWRTIKEGRRLPSKTATILFRELDDADRRGPTRVNFFREGMWITNNHYPTRPFADRERFDAVVLADPDNGRRFSELVRRSEGAAHYDINRRNLPKEDRKELEGMLDEILKTLLEAAASVTEGSWRPPGFATFGGGKERRPRPVPLRGYVPTGGTVPPGPIPPGPQPPGPIPPGPRPPAPLPGKPADVPFAFVELALDEQRNNTIHAIQVELGPHKEGALGVRVIRATGGDETCDIVTRPEFCRISPGSSDSSGLKESGPFEVLVPTELRRFQIEMTTPVERGRGPLALDIVKRQS